jgi:hypothetical protein
MPLGSTAERALPCGDSRIAGRAASFGLRISARSGVISVSNPSGSASAGRAAGYIQFVVGITDWNASVSMKSRKARASSGWSLLSRMPATSICM